MITKNDYIIYSLRLWQQKEMTHYNQWQQKMITYTEIDNKKQLHTNWGYDNKKQWHNEIMIIKSDDILYSLEAGPLSMLPP